MRLPVKQTIVRAALAMAASTALAPAHAGLVSGNWDPPFGPSLPGLSWALQAEFFVPNGCFQGMTDGAHGCVGATVNNAKLRMFNTAANNPGQTIDFGNPLFGLQVTGIQVYGGQVVGVATTRPTLAARFENVPETRDVNFPDGNQFELRFGLTAPDLRCITCSNPFIPGGTPAELGNLEQILITYLSTDKTQPALLDLNNNAVGVVLNGAGRFQNYTTSPVPEPATAAMALAGLGLLAAIAKRRRRQA